MKASFVVRSLGAWRPFVSGLLLLLAFEPFHQSWAVFVALVPWLLSLRGGSVKDAWKSGYMFGLIYGAGQLHWIQAFAERWTGDAALSCLPWALASLAFAVYIGLSGILIRACWSLDAPWLIPFAWAGVEVFRSYVPVFAFPWGLIAYPLAGIPPLIGSAHFGTVFLTSAWIVSVDTAFAIALAGGERRFLRRMCVAGMVVLAASVGYWISKPKGTPFKVCAGQPGIDMAFGQPTAINRLLRTACDAIVTQANDLGANLLVLPEGISGARDGVTPIVPYTVQPKCPVLIGGQRGENPTYQSAFLFDGTWSHADKTRLVIFGEFVPGRDWIPLLSAFKLPRGDLSAGADGVTTLYAGPIAIGPVICFEGLFPDIAYQHAAHGAQILAVMSIDDWYMGTSAPSELRDASIFRAVETGLPLVRAATTGHTLIVDSRGNVLREAPIGRTDALAATVTLPSRPSLVDLSIFFPAGCLAVIVLLPALTRWPKKPSSS